MVECPQCAQVYDDPHILTCQHTFCKHCIAELEQDHLVVCPVCDVESDPSEAQPDINKQQLMGSHTLIGMQCT